MRYLIGSVFIFITIYHLKAQKIDSLVLYKNKHKLLIYSKGNVIKTYKVALGSQPVGKKHFEGDGKTPEGTYYINGKNPYSKYHLNLGISYPNKRDKAYAKKRAKSPGGAIKIHGLPKKYAFIGSLHHFLDWTQGCIAVNNDEIEEIYKLVPVGTLIKIYP